MRWRGQLAPVEVLADTIYGGDDTLDRAKVLGVEVVAPAAGTPSPLTISLADFSFSAVEEMTACPVGQKPMRINTGKRQGRTVHFNPLVCDSSPLRQGCPVKRVKRSCSISYDAKALRLTRRRSYEKTDAFREKYRYRAGIEGTMSDLDRLNGIKHLRVRGMTRVRTAAVLKATELNILRATAFKKRHKIDTPSGLSPTFVPRWVVGAFKEQLNRCLGYASQFWQEFFAIITSADGYIAQAA